MKTAKIVSWNVNSVRQRLPNLLEFLISAQPDVLCLQELKCMEDNFPFMELKAAGYEAVIVGQKSYNGVAVLTKAAVPAVLNTLGDEQARYIEIDFNGVRVINIYAPNGNPIGTEKFSYKLDWLARLRARIQTLLNEGVPFVVTGDYNIIPEAADCYSPAAWVGDALYQPESRAMYRTFINMGLTDAVRMFAPRDAGLYTFWDYQAGSWPQNNGIRIDHFLMSPQVTDRCRSYQIHKDERGRENPSDHVPVEISITMPS